MTRDTAFEMATSNIRFGPGITREVGMDLADLGVRRTLVLTDPHMATLPPVEIVRESLAAEHIEFDLYDQVRVEPTDQSFQHAIEVARAGQYDAFLAVGGGSTIDTAKAANLYATYPDDFLAYVNAPLGSAKPVPGPLKPLIAVPTTAGTGSECQSFALIADADTHQKMACGDPKAAPVIAVLDPTLTVTQPRQVTANTGIDAVAHALETAVTRTRTEQSWHYSCDAFRLTAGNLSSVLESPDCIDSRAGMQLGACHAGLAIELSMLGAAHSAANPLTARFGITHGRAVGMMLPHVVRFNAEEPDARAAYEKMATFVLSSDESTEPTVDGLVACLESLLRTADFPESLVECGVTDDVVPELAIEAADQWTAKFNPRSVSVSDFDALYRSALGS